MTDEIKERYEDRAASMHFCGGIPKEKADALARAECETYMAHRAKVDADKVQKLTYPAPEKNSTPSPSAPNFYERSSPARSRNTCLFHTAASSSTQAGCADLIGGRLTGSATDASG